MYSITEELLDLFRVPELISDLTEDRGRESFYHGPIEIDDQYVCGQLD
jgi:hypothetical protein